MKRGLGFWALWVFALTGLGSGCAMPQKKRDGLVLGAMTGAIVGGGAGAGIASSGDRDDLGPGIAIGAAGGAVIGGLIGYLLAGEEAAPAPAAQPGAPAARPAPTPPPPSAAAPAPRESKKIVLRGINFDFDKSNIKREFVPVLDEAAQILKDNPSVKVTIEGHTDSKGTDAYNQKLSERRANAVKHYLESKGVTANRLDAVGKGESQPVAPNTKPNGKDNPEGRAMNRRAELKVQ
jgi:outer membrane protein OmpA-like peptidoglycan-associated protein